MCIIQPTDITCLITCAGRGTRMRPLTLRRRKQLLTLCNIPVMDIILRDVQLAGIRRVVLIVDPKAQPIRDYVGMGGDYVGDGNHGELTIEYAVQEQTEGTGHAVLCAKNNVETPAVMVYLGDSTYERKPGSAGPAGDWESHDAGVAEFVEKFVRGYPDSLIRVQPVGLENAEAYGVVAPNDPGVPVAKLWEKRRPPPTELAITGVYAFPVQFFDAIERTPKSARGELEITDSIQTFIDQYKQTVHAERFCGVWADAGQPQQLLKASRDMLALVAEAAVGEEVYGVTKVNADLAAPAKQDLGCSVTGPVLIGANVSVTDDCRLDRNVTLGRNCTLSSSTLTNCIAEEGAEVVDCYLTDSIVGVGAKVSGIGTKDSAASVVVGDYAALSA